MGRDSSSRGAARQPRLSARKRTATELLKAYDLDGIAAWALQEPRASSTLASLLFHREPVLAWRAVEGLARVAGVRAGEDPEAAREIVRRQLWLMSDESGGVAWHGPQVIAATIAGIPPLLEEYLSILASFLEEEPFRVGTRWGLWRVGSVAPEKLAFRTPDLHGSLKDPDPAVRGHAILALRRAMGPGSRGLLAPLEDDEAPFTFFDFNTGTLQETTVAAVVRSPSAP